MLGWRKKARSQKARVERDGSRHEASYRVMSRDLPGFSAITADLSRTGVQLETTGPLEVDATLVLSLEFDKEELADFSCPASVVWCKQDGVSRRFRVGLTFTPQTDDEKRNLSLMATVLQARTEADLKVLLEEANRVDPDRAETYARVNSAAQEEENETALKAIMSHPGVYIPMSVFIEGYAWERKNKSLTLTFLEGTQVHKLYFPRCQMLTDYNCASEQMVVGMFTTLTSPAIRMMQAPAQPEDALKHYRFVAGGGMPVLDMISGPAQSYAPD